MRKYLGLFIIAVLLPQFARADAVEEFAAALRPVSGVVVMAAGNDYLIDLDAAKGVRAGDVVSVLAPGEKITHPVSGVELGTLDTVKGFLQVTQVKTGFSHARPIGAAPAVARGDAIRLWERVPAAFAADGGDPVLHRQLRAALPHLDWRDAATEALLLIVASPERLELRGPGGALLRSATAAPPTPAAPAAEGAGAIVRERQDAAEGLWLSEAFTAEAVGVHVGELDGDGRQEVAIAFPYRLEAGRIAGGVYTRIAAIDLGYGQKVVGLDGADLNRDGRDELYLTAAGDGELRSLVAGLENGRVQIFQKHLPWYLRTIELPEEGRVLLGQRMGRPDEDFAGVVFRLKVQDGRWEEGEPVRVPPGSRLFGFLPLPPRDGKSAFLRLSPFDELQVVDRDGTILWTSEEKAGGSEAFIERPDPAKNPSQGPAMRSLFLPARLLAGPDGTVLVPVNEGSRFFSRTRSFDNSRLRAMVWNGYALQELWHTQPQAAYLADFRLADADNDGKAEVIQALVFSRDGLLSKGRSALAVFELP